ncbi:MULTISPECIES: hypothetical protein [Thalassolituus]|jgi:hypothetical protein|uniref:Uncharacterized protein n=1 Tax=Thalassolituus oleivorans MIL-1 TaxID=1298593 RepID=M5DYJ6_9GAMM|nr:hypothetical protein [Thalassolituus oleivorans]AHK17179.1 hypothetical protein R615_00680 [Thalassolituus oleivorans R6-15]APR65666.1 hypothetical protein CN03_01260 [Thalassolituus oleivorans]MCA6127697.1 hypothetical protein [Thalassolituus oleivorans 4BN06-13]MDF1639345.1 hypothetical protein [Thalassolituus oleivorans]CCU70584.1 hypothetical protein TOL_0135 [Thalassolituus oleivorans MIL-1]
MLQGFSKTTLNVIVLGCLALIAWINLAHQNPEDTPLDALNQAPLSERPWHAWQSLEGTWLYWQNIRSENVVVKVRMEGESFSAPVDIDSELPLDQWAQLLIEQLKDAPTNRAGILFIQGPLDERSLQTAAAYAIRTLALRPLTQHQPNACLELYPAGARWFSAAQQQSWALASAATNALPDRSQWQAFRIQQSSELRDLWFSDAGQVDIQADLAYHSLPNNFFSLLYRDLGESQKTAASDYQDCMAKIVTPESL